MIIKCFLTLKTCVIFLFVISYSNGGSCVIDVRKNPYYFDVSPRCCGQGAASDAVKCPPPEAAKGKIAAGSKFTVEWPARNHATPGQDPDGGISEGVSMYLASSTATTLGDYCGSTTIDKNCPNKICQGSFGPSTCGGQNGDMVPCNIECTIPATTPSPTRRPTLPPFTLPPTAVGAPKPDTLSPTGTVSSDCGGSEKWAPFETEDFGIRFVNLPKEVPFRACRNFPIQLYYKKSTTTLGMVVIDILDKDGEWHGKGIEVVPGAFNGRTEIPLKVWEGKELDPTLGPYRLKAYFVDKSVYDLGVEDGSYSKDPMVERTSVESDPFCAGCSYIRNCGVSATPQCDSLEALNYFCPPGPADRTKCPVDGMMRDILPVIADSSAFSNFGILGTISALLLFICTP